MSSETKNKPSGKAFDTSLLKRLLSYTAPYRKLFLIGLLITIVSSLLILIRPILYGAGIDRYVIHGDDYHVRLLVLLMIVVLLFETALSYVNTLLTNWLGQSVVRDLRNQVFTHILHLKMSYYDQNPIGQLQTRTISDVETVNSVFRAGIVKISGDLLQLVAILVYMFWVNWQLTLAILTTVPLMVIATRIFQKYVKQSFQEVRKEVGAMNGFLQEHISGVSIVQIFNREEIEYERFDKINANMQKANFNSNLYYSIFFPVVEFISNLALAILVWYGVTRIITVGDMQIGEVVTFISLLGLFFRPIRMLADEFNNLQLGMVSAERLFAVLDTKEFIKNEGKNTHIPLHNQDFTIEFKDVWFAYKDEDWVLKGINLFINKGEKVAFIGSTGSGKTTIINLLGRFYEIQKGEILINGINIRDFPLTDLRKMMGVVLQDVFLFSGSIYENVTLNNNDIPLSDVVDAAKQVGANDFIENLPDGFDYQVRERGVSLSLGQRQLIAFARVWVYNPLLLILDEATANIDTESEEMIQQAIDRVMVGRTSIIIAHRLSTIQKADKIVVLDKGNILEVGSHQQLLAQKGKYFEFYELQFEGAK